MFSFFKVHSGPDNPIDKHGVAKELWDPTRKGRVVSVSRVKELSVVLKALVSQNQELCFLLTDFRAISGLYLCLFLVLRVNYLVEPSKTCIHIEPCDPNGMIMIPVIASLLLIWVVINSLVCSAYLLGLVAGRLYTAGSPVGLRLPVRRCLCRDPVGMRNCRHLLHESLIGSERVVQIHRQNMRTWNIVLPCHLDSSVLRGIDRRTWKTSLISTLRLPTVRIDCRLVEHLFW